MESTKKLTVMQRICAVVLGRVTSAETNHRDIDTERDRLSFANTSEEVLTASKNEPGKSHISYDPELIGNLKNDHVKLFQLFKLITKQLKAKSFKDAKNTLKKFQFLLRMHVIEETVKLYCGIDSMTQSLPDFDNQEVKEMKLEMAGIQRTVSKIINDYLNVGISKSNVDEFLEKWVGREGADENARDSRQNSVQSIFSKRIDAEEDRLYRIYKSLGEQELVNRGVAKNV